jgi:hypothetical protein
MEMISPAPFKSKQNPHAGSDVDYSQQRVPEDCWP